MRITIDIRLLARGGTTGIPGYTRDLIESLVSGEQENQYTLFYNGLHKKPLPTDWVHNQKIKIFEKRIPNRLLDLVFRYYGTRLIEKNTTPDLLFSPHFNLLPKTSTPRVITFHDLSFLHYPDFFSRQQQLWHHLQRYAEQAKRARQIIAVSEFTKTDLIRFLKIPAEKITVIYSGINQSFRARPKNDSMLNEYKSKLELEKPFWLYLGSLEPRKNIPLLIKAFTAIKANPQFKDYELVLAGKLGYRAKDVIKLIKSSPASENIRLLGPVPDNDRTFLYGAARAVVFPSWFEGFGFPPLEAQACGTPVIASNRTSLPEILGSSALLIDPWNISALVENMQLLENDEGLRQKICAAGTANAARFDWKIAAEQTVRVFNRAIL